MTCGPRCPKDLRDPVSGTFCSGIVTKIYLKLHLERKFMMHMYCDTTSPNDFTRIVASKQTDTSSSVKLPSRIPYVFERTAQGRARYT